MEEKKVVSTGGAGVGPPPKKVSHLRPLSTFIHPPCASFSPCPISPPDRGLAGVPHKRVAGPRRNALPRWKRSTLTAIRSALNGRPLISGWRYRRKSGKKFQFIHWGVYTVPPLCKSFLVIFPIFFWNYFWHFQGENSFKKLEKMLKNSGKIPINSQWVLDNIKWFNIIFLNFFPFLVIFSDYFWNYFDIFRGKIRLKNSKNM